MIRFNPLHASKDYFVGRNDPQGSCHTRSTRQPQRQACTPVRVSSSPSLLRAIETTQGWPVQTVDRRGKKWHYSNLVQGAFQNEFHFLQERPPQTWSTVNWTGDGRVQLSVSHHELDKRNHQYQLAWWAAYICENHFIKSFFIGLHIKFFRDKAWLLQTWMHFATWTHYGIGTRTGKLAGYSIAKAGCGTLGILICQWKDHA